MRKQKILDELINSTFKEFGKTIKLSESSRETIEKCVLIFIDQFDKKLNLDRCLDKGKSIEVELINDLEGMMIIAQDTEIVKDCLKRISEYKRSNDV
jgi:hypothetical protein